MNRDTGSLGLDRVRKATIKTIITINTRIRINRINLTDKTMARIKTNSK